MREEIVDIATAHGAMETFVCRPERGGPYPPVLFLMDAPGIREELHDMARRLATVGFFVMLPNLYYRAGRDTKYGPHVLVPASPDNARMLAVRRKMTIPPVMEDVRVMLDWAARPRGSRERPGRHPRLLHERPVFARRRRALPGPDRGRRRLLSRHLARERRRGEPAPHLREDEGGDLHLVRRARRGRSPRHGRGGSAATSNRREPAGEIEIHPGAHHGFAFPERWCYDKPAAERPLGAAHRPLSPPPRLTPREGHRGRPPSRSVEVARGEEAAGLVAGMTAARGG